MKIERYEIAYVWDHEKDKRPFDIELWNSNSQTVGFDKDPYGTWIDADDLLRRLNEIEVLEGSDLDVALSKLIEEIT